ncbi:hypothetical protein [Humisphaera borealis]|nr:hypothetical protein [Humisphaera borealis]
MSYFGDNRPTDEVVESLAQLTAEFRYCIVYGGTRRLLQDRGIDPMCCVLLGVHPGDDVALELMLPDGSVVEFESRDDPLTREHIELVGWTSAVGDKRNVRIARAHCTGERESEFSKVVYARYVQYWEDGDAPLRPKPAR